ncbi:MAG: imidazoleglycerol-phosphate dehydratase [Gemmatimonadales bacterium]
MTELVRETKETTIKVELDLDGGQTQVETTVPFLDHMLVTLARYAGVGLRLTAKGDLRHHLIEDSAIVFGEAMLKAAPASRVRYGHAVVPMDDALVECALDLGGRPYYRGPIPSSLYDHWMRSFADHARATLHLRVIRGRDRHHAVEAGFKALGMALRQAVRPAATVQSTKGPVRLGE